MRKIYFLSAIFLLIKTASAQVLLEDRDGEKIVSNNTVFSQIENDKLGLLKLNTGDQSLGFSYFISSALHDPSRYHVHEFGLKAAPTEGYAAVFRNGQFSPGLKANYGFTLVNLFEDHADGNTSFPKKKNSIDWLTVDVNFSFNKYSLYQPSAAFASQLYSKIANTYQALLSYNLLLNSKFILNLKAGYSRRNNFADLSSVEINDITTTTNSATNTQRQITSTTTASAGDLVEYNAFPQIIALTRATQTDDPNSKEAKQLRISYTLFLKNQFSSYLDKTDAGAIVFLASQNAKGIRNPLFGIVVQAVNLFDTQNLSNGLQKRIRIGFTTNFSL